MRFYSKKSILSALGLVFVWTLSSHPARASSNGDTPSDSKLDADEQVKVDAIKEKYWARGDESELGVVQDRLYTKTGKFSVSAFAGEISSDPFLSTYNTGATVGYYFNEYVAAQLTGWKSFASGSSALDLLQDTLHATADTNLARGYVGAEVQGSLIYGKISLLGKEIIHYDLHLLGGVGDTFTESGDYITPSVGIGQQIYLTKTIGLLIDYRLMYYREAILEKEIPTLLGQVVDEHNNGSNVVTVGVVFLLGGDAR